MPVIMRQTRFALSPDKLIMVQATIYALDYSKHVTVDLILDTGASLTEENGQKAQCFSFGMNAGPSWKRPKRSFFP